MLIPNNAHILVADGRKLLFFRNEGDAEHPNLQVETHKEEQVGASGGASGGGSTGESDPHQQQEDRFAIDTAEMLNKRVLAHKIDKLIVVAPPRTLGELRKHYHKEVEARLAGEIAKDLVNMSVAEIEKALRAA